MRWPLALQLLVAAAPAAAQPSVVSPRPDSVDVTVYRDPNRSPSRPFALQWLEGYALISETRTVTIPAGESDVRFEGVAGGIVPQSAIVTGFPDGLVERNRDAYLLSPATLLNRSLGRRVTLRRTSRATGEVREMDAIIRSGVDGAVVLQTPQGFEALRCSGTPETLLYSQVPEGLSAKPTLSVRVRSAQPLTATVTLSYLASGFDWQANYIAELSDDESRVELFAWLTLASNDETSFINADTQAVAGRLNREDVDIQPPQGGSLQLNCWPQSTTSDIPRQDGPPPPPPPPLAMMRMAAGAPASAADEESIVLTGSRIPSQERLGDLKLYRLVEPVTVAANSQKQVALLQQPAVAIDLVYRQRIYAASEQELQVTDRMLVTRNRTQEGLGLPLPGGGLVLFADGPDGRPILVGEGSMRDFAVGEDVEVLLSGGEGVRTTIDEISDDDDVTQYRLTVSNDRAVPVRFEGEFEIGDGERFRPRTRLARRDGRPLWTVTVPANGTAILNYSVRDAKVEEAD